MEHFFIFLAKGQMNGYDGTRHYTLERSDACLESKNHLARYNKVRDSNDFEKVIILFEESFLLAFKNKHRLDIVPDHSRDAFIKLKPNQKIDSFLVSLTAYYTETGSIDPAFADLKREELLLILLKAQPELKGVLFDFGIPGRVDLEAFMQANYKFNVCLDRLAFLTGRSLSAFERDFKTFFGETPNRWLVKRRLEEARFLIEEKRLKANDNYLDLGFEDLSHFSFAFKKEFGLTVTALSEKVGKKP